MSRPVEHPAFVFSPSSVALIGASDRRGSLGWQIWRGVTEGGSVPVYPINPKYKYIELVPCWPKLSSLPHHPELAVVAITARRVGAVLRQCAKSGVRSVILTAPATDGEIGDESARLARRLGLRLLGPDAYGLILPRLGLNISRWPHQVRPGHIGLICQSPSLTGALLERAKTVGTGFSAVIGSGDDGDVGPAEALDFLAQDPATAVIALAWSEIRRPRATLSALRAAARVKPVIALLATPPGPSDEPLTAAVRRAGGQTTTSLDDFSGALQLLSRPLAPAGGALEPVAEDQANYALIRRALARYGRLPPDPRGARGHHVPPPPAMGHEPSAATIVTAAEAAIRRSRNDAVLLVLSATPTDARALTQALAQLQKNYGRPLLTCLPPGADPELSAGFGAVDLSTFSEPGAAARAVILAAAALRRREAAPAWSAPLPDPDLTKAREIILSARGGGAGALSDERSAALWGCFGLTARAAAETEEDQTIIDSSRDPTLGPVLRVTAPGSRLTLFPPLSERAVAAALSEAGLSPKRREALGRALLAASHLLVATPALSALRLSQPRVEGDGVSAIARQTVLDERPELADAAVSHLLFGAEGPGAARPDKLPCGLVVIRPIRGSDLANVTRFLAGRPEDEARALLEPYGAAGDPRAAEELCQPDPDRDLILIAIDDSRIDPRVHAIARLSPRDQDPWSGRLLLADEAWLEGGVERLLRERVDALLAAGMGQPPAEIA